MGKCLVKLAENEYVEWSSVVDAPITVICTRDEMVEHLRDEYGRNYYGRGPEGIEADLAECDARNTSATLGGRPYSRESVIESNRCGEWNEDWERTRPPDDDEYETTMTLDEIREWYREDHPSRQKTS